MSEMERLKYDNTLKKLEDIRAEAGEAAASGSDRGMYHVKEQIRSLRYDFDEKNMGEAARRKCSELKERIARLKEGPDDVFRNLGEDVVPASTGRGRTLLSCRGMSLAGVWRFPCSLNAGDKLALSLNCQGAVNVRFYDVNRQTCLRQWTVNSPRTDSLAITSRGIYLVELLPAAGETVADVTLAYKGTDAAPRPRVREKKVACRPGDFLAEMVDSVAVVPVFGEPRRVGLRGNLKSLVSGKSCALVSVPVPKGCDALLYSLRVSTNEQTQPADGKFANRLSMASQQVKLFGVNVYEHAVSSDALSRLLFNTRPAREEDAFCNLYVFADARQAKKFQDETSSSGSYRYDVEQSQMGTQSCNGQLKPKGSPTLYLGFENERMRYDTYIWLEVAALKHTTHYVRPVYTAR